MHFNALSPENIPYLAHIMLKRATPQYHKYTSSKYPAKHTEDSAVFVSVPENILPYPLLNIPCDTNRHKHRLGAHHEAASPVPCYFYHTSNSSYTSLSIRRISISINTQVIRNDIPSIQVKFRLRGQRSGQAYQYISWYIFIRRRLDLIT